VNAKGGSQGSRCGKGE
jgi:hypothetical protein